MCVLQNKRSTFSISILNPIFRKKQQKETAQETTTQSKRLQSHRLKNTVLVQPSVKERREFAGSVQFYRNGNK